MLVVSSKCVQLCLYQTSIYLFPGYNIKAIYNANTGLICHY